MPKENEVSEVVPIETVPSTEPEGAVDAEIARILMEERCVSDGLDATTATGVGGSIDANEEEGKEV
jgi:hypothetical protein